MPFIDSAEQRQNRYQLGYESGIEGETKLITEKDWVSPELHLAYEAGFKAGRTKFVMAIRRLNQAGELRAIVEELE